MNYFVWDGSPIIFEIGPIAIRYYSLLFAAAVFTGYTFMKKVFIKENKSLADLERLFIFIVVGLIIGARLGHVLFYNPSYYFSNPSEILAIWKGGLASHGSIIGILIGAYFGLKKTKNISFLWFTDRLSVYIFFSCAMIRLGNFFNSEILGKGATVPWAIIFKNFDNVPRYPVQLMESVAYLIVGCILMIAYQNQFLKEKRGILTGIGFVLAFTSRFLLENYKIKQAAYENYLGLNTGQWLSIPGIIIGFILILLGLKLNQKKRIFQK